MVQKWHYVDGKLEALPRKVPGLYLERDGYYRFPTTSTEWFADIPHLRREDGRAFFVVVTATFLHVPPGGGEHSSSDVFFFDDDLCLNIRWDETYGVDDPRHVHLSSLYGVRTLEMGDSFRLLTHKQAVAETSYGAPVNGYLQADVLVRVKNALLEGWREWPTPGMRRLSVERERFSGKMVAGWASVPHVLSYDGRPGEWHQSDGVVIRDDAIVGPRSYFVAVSTRDWINANT
jgi:hypothetical protein